MFRYKIEYILIAKIHHPKFCDDGILQFVIANKNAFNKFKHRRQRFFVLLYVSYLFINFLLLRVLSFR